MQQLLFQISQNYIGYILQEMDKFITRDEIQHSVHQ